MWQKLAVIFLIIVVLLLPSYVVATQTTAGVTINATGNVTGLPWAPTNLTVTRVAASILEVTWTKDVSANHTVLRIKGGSYPANITDGAELYDGTGEVVEYGGVDLDSETYYIMAWSQNDYGNSIEYAQTRIGGVILALLLFGILGLGLTFGFFWKRSGFLAYGAVGAWALLGFQSLTASASASPIQITDTYMALFWLCVAFVIGCALLPTVMREKPSKDDIYVDEIDEAKDLDGSDLSEFVAPAKKETPTTKEKPSKFAEKGTL